MVGILLRVLNGHRYSVLAHMTISWRVDGDRELDFVVRGVWMSKMTLGFVVP